MTTFPPVSQIVGNHKSTYDSYFIQADSKSTGFIGALDGAAYLKKSGLTDKVLSQIWDLADPLGRGYLDKEAFYVALKLVSLAQSGQEVGMSNVTLDTPPPNLGPVPVDMMSVMGQLQLGDVPLILDMNWDVPQSEKVKFDQIFDGLGPVSGRLSGDKFKPVLLNSKLPVDILGRVWDLSDIDRDGFLDRDEFALAMHLVYRALEKDPVPVSLPATLIPPSKRQGPTSPRITNLPSSPGLGTGSWVVSPMDKAKFDEMFKKADTDMDDYVNGAEIKDIFLQSGLPQNVLAHIWNLCDMQNMGKLNSEQFALAMYFVQQKMKGMDPPSQLTPDMCPPSMRTKEPVVDFNTTGMKEIDMIQKDFNMIKMERARLEQERAQRISEIGARNMEIMQLQQELDRFNSTVTKLENQKGEAQKRLDELDDRKTKMEADVEELKDKVRVENELITRLRTQMSSADSQKKSQKDEMTEMKEALNKLRQEEMEMQQKLEAGRRKLRETEDCSVQQSIDKISAGVSKMKSFDVELCDLVKLCRTYLNQPPDQSTMAIDVQTVYNLIGQGQALLEEQKKLQVVHQQPPRPATTPIATNRVHTEDPFGGHDPFTSDDPFKAMDPFKSDPFASEDPFGASAFGKSGSSDGVFSKGSDPFGGGTQKETVKKDPFGPSSSKKNLDPFAPFPGANQLASPINPADPFGADPFMPTTHAPTRPASATTKSKAAPTRPIKSPTPGKIKSPAPSLPPKQKKAPPPPRPPAPKPGKNSRGGTPEPFQDEFGSDFANFSSAALPEDTQLAWATQSSNKEWLRQQKLKEQEEADFQLALKLSQMS